MKVAFLFPGQGASDGGARRSLCASSRAARETFEAGERLRPGLIDMALGDDPAFFSDNSVAQPVIFLHDLACARALAELGAKPDRVAGFSIGEFAALCHSGMIGFDDCFRLVCLRGAECEKIARAEPGAMIAVMTESSCEAERLCAEFGAFRPANYNGFGQTVCAGPAERADAFMEFLARRGARSIRLGLKAMFHSPSMAPVRAKLLDALRTVRLAPPKMPVYSNFAGAPYGPPSGFAELIASQVDHPVRFTDILADLSDFDAFVECGPGRTLSGFVRRTLKSKSTFRAGDADGVSRAARFLAGRAGASGENRATPNRSADRATIEHVGDRKSRADRENPDSTQKYVADRENRADCDIRAKLKYGADREISDATLKNGADRDIRATLKHGADRENSDAISDRTEKT